MKLLAVLATLFVLCNLISAFADYEDCMTNFNCQVGDPVRSRLQNNLKFGKREVLISNNVANVFELPSVVTSFNIHVLKKNKPIYLGVWREVVKGKTYKLLGSKQYTPTHKGVHHVKLSPSEYINVQPGDTLGVHYFKGPRISWGSGTSCKAKALVNTIGSSVNEINVGDERNFKRLKRCVWISILANQECAGLDRVEGSKSVHPCEENYKEATHPCDEADSPCDHECIKDGDEYFCACNDGYKLLSDRKSCELIHPCDKPRTPCDQRCIKKGAEYMCGCDSGYELLEDAKSCKAKPPTHPCDEAKTPCDHVCRKSARGYHCACNDGYKLLADQTSCELIHPCDKPRTPCDQRCIKKGSEFSCGCDLGYELLEDAKSCKAVHPCDKPATPCDQICMKKGDEFMCACGSGYELLENAKSCKAISKPSTGITSCATSNGGCEQLCFQDGDKFECDCKASFILTADKKTCKEYVPIPEATFMIQEFAAPRDRVCFNVDFGSAKFIRLIQDADNGISVNGKVEQSSDPDHTYLSEISFAHGSTYILFDFNKVTIDGTDYAWDKVPANVGDYEIIQKRPGEAIIVKFRVGRRQVQLLFDKSEEFSTKAKRLEFTLFRDQGLSTNVNGIIGDYYKTSFGPVDTTEKLYGTKSKFDFAGTEGPATSYRHYNSRNGRTMQCWEVEAKIPLNSLYNLTNMKA